MSKWMLRRAAQVRDDAQRGEPGPVPSPCVSVCRMDAVRGVCEGCWRTLEEIAGWSGFDDATRRVVWARIEQRIAQQRQATA